jgi:hypothetical protein
MTQDEVIDMARQVGYPIQHPEWQKATEEFAALVAAKEREECAKVCEELPPVGESKQWERATLKDCAAAIRARGEQA